MIVGNPGQAIWLAAPRRGCILELDARHARGV